MSSSFLFEMWRKAWAHKPGLARVIMRGRRGRFRKLNLKSSITRNRKRDDFPSWGDGRPGRRRSAERGSCLLTTSKIAIRNICFLFSSHRNRQFQYPRISETKFTPQGVDCQCLLGCEGDLAVPCVSNEHDGSSRLSFYYTQKPSKILYSHLKRNE